MERSQRILPCKSMDAVWNKLRSRPLNSIHQTCHNHFLPQKRFIVSFETHRKENQHVSAAIRQMVEAAPVTAVQVERINLAGCNAMIPRPLESCINRSMVRIKVLTHVDTISEEALRHQLAYVEVQERLKYPPSSKKYPTAIIAVNLSGVEKAKELRLVQDCIFGATEVGRNNQVWVCGSPNSGKSSLILPLTKNRTMVVRNKRAYHLPKISELAGKTLGIKKHVMESRQSSTQYHSEVTLIDTPGLRPNLEDPRTPAALMFAARVTELFSGYQELCHNDQIMQLQLEACNRHSILTMQYAYYLQEAQKLKATSPSSTDSESPASPPLINILDEKNPLKHIRPKYLDLFNLHEATNDPAILRAAAKEVLPSCSDKKIFIKFHQFDCGGCIFTPNHKYHSALINHAANMRFHYGSPIMYMNEAAVRLIDVHHGRILRFDPTDSKSYLNQ